MENKEILKKAVEKAFKNEWQWPELAILQMSASYQSSYGFPVIFNHDFAKAFWKDYGIAEDWWKRHLMVIQKDPIKYLEKFI